MLNIFKGKGKDKNKDVGKSFEEQLAAFPGAPKLEDMNMAEKFAMKRFLKMSPEDQKKTIEKTMTPKNIEKNKTQIIASIEEMRKNQMISDDQYRLMKRKYGIR